MATTLTLAHGRNVHASRAALVTLSNAGEPWQNNGRTLRGVPGPARSWGQLYGDAERAELAGADYVVYSYSTPIAWRVAGTWTVSVDRYSVTTSRHQSAARALLCREGCVS